MSYTFFSSGSNIKKSSQVVYAQIFTIFIQVDHTPVLAVISAQAYFNDCATKPARIEELPELIPDIPDCSVRIAVIELSLRALHLQVGNGWCFSFSVWVFRLEWNVIKRHIINDMNYSAPKRISLTVPQNQPVSSVCSGAKRSGQVQGRRQMVYSDDKAGSEWFTLVPRLAANG